VDVVLDLMIHDIDLALTLAKSPVVSVAANGATIKSDTTDEAEAWLVFANGLIATLSASRVAEVNERVVTVTEPGFAWHADLTGPSLTYTPRGQRGASGVSVAMPKRDNLGAEIAAFLNSVATGAPPMVDGAAGVAALEIGERIRAAIEEPLTAAGARLS
jgi:predicted dehydrogenase